MRLTRTFRCAMQTLEFGRVSVQVPQFCGFFTIMLNASSFKVGLLAAAFVLA